MRQEQQRHHRGAEYARRARGRQVDAGRRAQEAPRAVGEDVRRLRTGMPPSRTSCSPTIHETVQVAIAATTAGSGRPSLIDNARTAHRARARRDESVRRRTRRSTAIAHRACLSIARPSRRSTASQAGPSRRTARLQRASSSMCSMSRNPVFFARTPRLVSQVRAHSTTPMPTRPSAIWYSRHVPVGDLRDDQEDAQRTGDRGRRSGRAEEALGRVAPQDQAGHVDHGEDREQEQRGRARTGLRRSRSPTGWRRTR